MTSTVFSAQFENLGELVKNLIFPVGVDTFPTELSGRLRHVFSPAGAGPETLTGYLCLGKRREIEQAGLKARLTEKRKMIIAPLCKLSVCLHLLLLYRKRIIRVYIVYTYDNKTGEILEHKYPINRLCNDSIIEHI